MKNLVILVSFLMSTAHADPVKINPESLRTLLMSGNNGIMTEMNKLYVAKDNLNIARSKILPSVSIGVVTSPSFLVSSISSLLSFLMPGSWLNLKQDKQLLKSEEMSYYILQLNQYASAYALYQTITNDMALRDIYEKEYENLEHIYSVLKAQSEFGGTVGAGDLAQAQGQAQMAKIQVDSTDLAIANEKSDLRQALGMTPDQELVFEVGHTPASAAESGKVSDITAQAIAIAPENIQLDYMISAAKTAKWSNLFSFFGSSTLGAIPNNSGVGNSVSLDRTVQSNSFSNLGFGMIPNFQLGNDNIDAIQLQKEAVALQEVDVISKALSSIELTKNEEDMATKAEANFMSVYQVELVRYQMGLADLLHVLTAENQMTSASVARVLNQLNLDNLRINLHRALITDQFAQIKGCGGTEPANVGGGFFNWLGGRRAAHATIDEVCGPQQADQSAE